MQVLIVKLSSMGDLIQALPALTDAQQAIPGIQFDWAVDESFAEIPTWHPAIRNTIKTALGVRIYSEPVLVVSYPTLKKS